MPAEIKFANGESLRIDEDPREVLKAIQEADEIGPLMIASVGPTRFTSTSIKFDLCRSREAVS